LNSTSEKGVRNENKMTRWICFLAIAAVGAIADLWTKSWVFEWLGLPLPGSNHAPYWIVEGYFGLETAINPGAVFGMGAGFGLFFAALSVAASIGICLWLTKFKAYQSWWLVIALGMIQAGIIGNLYDRLGLWDPPASIPLWASGVRDWILFRYGAYTWPNFNIADSLLVCGAIMLAVHSFRNSPPAEMQKATHSKESRRPS
jgi:signal peptidase II